MSLTDLLEEKGVKIEKLNVIEKEHYFNMLKSVQKAELTPEKLKSHISSMREAVERELINEPEFNYIFIFKVPNRKQILLKARLGVYILLESFLNSPVKAKEMLEEMVGDFVSNSK